MFSVENDNVLFNDKQLTPKQIVVELDRYIIAQEDAKKAVAVALRNRWRRLRVEGEIKDEITPKNIIMIGPTGVGKTEIARRLAKLAAAPFVKVEASKFTEVGYVGRDVESIIRDLMEMSITLVKEEEREKVKKQAEQSVEDQLLDLLLPDSQENTSADTETKQKTRERLRQMLKEGKLEERMVEIEVTRPMSAHFEVFGPPMMGDMENQFREVLGSVLPKAKDKKKLPVSDARKLLLRESQEELIDQERVSRTALKRAEQTGIVFIDEIDKICGRDQQSKGPDVSREGVQRDLLPLVEGCTVTTKYGPIKTDHILFIASGAFHFSKPSDLMPEFQGRFPIRVELRSLTAEHFVRILTEPKNALIKQYTAMLATENLEVEFTEDAIVEIAKLTAEVNSRTENIGARRLHTLLEKMLEELSFVADELVGQKITINKAYVQERLGDIVQDQDLSRYIL
ncbi:MAG: ATP-dependent protease ATPase subunit HslU [Deltaproteobacteria bacterium]|nr:ATP-dependent protease ATPase subunit HslU [Deltaproteobacteria bacterium]